ncbi:MAG: hypothetical protein ABI647_10075 [Gemmatimonadota bacterium]
MSDASGSDNVWIAKADGAERVASLATRRAEWQEAVRKGYVALEAEIEAAAKR